MRLRKTLAAVATLAVAAAGAVLPVSSAAAHGDQVRAKQWYLIYLRIAEAQRSAQGEGVTVAVIDTGVASHDDLAGNVLDGTDTTSGSPAGSGRGDTDGHGTGLAGVIAAHGHGTNNADGALGIAPKAKILPIKAAPSGVASDASIAAGIRYAVAQGAKILNISQSLSGSATLTAVGEARRAGVLILAAAGNAGSDITVAAPARYEGVVAVASVDRAGNHAATSLEGEKVEIAAPGVDIITTGPNNVWQNASGTSFATAVASGVAALVWSKYPNLSAAEVLRRIELTVNDKGATGRDPQYGFGVVDPVNALTANVPAATSAAAPSATSKPVVVPSAQPSEPETKGSPILVIGLVILGLAVLVLIIVITIFALRRRSKP